MQVERLRESMSMGCTPCQHGGAHLWAGVMPGNESTGGTREKRFRWLSPCNTAQAGGEGRASGTNVCQVEPRPHWAACEGI